MVDRTQLRTLLGDYPHTERIKSDRLRSDAVAFDFAAIRPVHAGFADMVRRLDFELCELAVVTALQAIAVGKPIVLMPVVLSSRFQRDRLIALASRRLSPRDLVGQAVGVRAFTQTTGMWVRSALFEDYGIATGQVRWRTRDGAHVAEYRDPPFVEHDGSGQSLPDKLRAGDIAAAIMGNDLPEDPEFVRLIADHAQRDRQSYERDGFMPVNHMLVASAAAVETKPDAIRAAYALMKQAAAEAPPPAGKPAPFRFGSDAVLAPLSRTIDEAVRQRLLDQPLATEDLLAPAARLLGD